jgi:PASTA domain
MARKVTPGGPGELGSPGEEDPLGDSVNVPQPAAAPGDAAELFADQLDELGLTDVKFKVLSNPDFEPAFDEGAVVRVSPPPGTSVEPGDEIVVTVNRTAQRDNHGECDRSAHQDPGPAPSGDEFALKDTFSGRDPDQDMAPTDIPFRWGNPTWGYRHVEIEHGWDNERDRADTQAALFDPAPEPDDPGSHQFYFFYLGPTRVPCTRRVVARFDVRGQEPAKRGIITSFAYPGWWRRTDFP